MDLKRFVELSNYLGNRFDFVQGSGGNVSVKIDSSKMYIKSSGFHLADVKEDYGCTVVDYFRLSSFHLDSTSNLNHFHIDRIISEITLTGPKPSIEVFFHSMTRKYTLHSHSILCNSILFYKDGLKEIKKLFPESLTVDYIKPGIDLFLHLKDNYSYISEIEEQIIFLSNHGVIVSCDNYHRAIEIHEEIHKKLSVHLGVDYSPLEFSTKLMDYVHKTYDMRKVVILSYYNHLDSVSEKIAFKELDLQICPDCIVFCGKRVLVLESESQLVIDFNSFFESYGFPKVVKYKQSFYFISDSWKNAKYAEDVFLMILSVLRINNYKSPVQLSHQDSDNLVNWEEDYRIKIL